MLADCLLIIKYTYRLELTLISYFEIMVRIIQIFVYIEGVKYIIYIYVIYSSDRLYKIKNTKYYQV